MPASLILPLFERQCLGRRIANVDELWERISALEAERNGRHGRIHWSFTTEQARAKLQALYPVLKQT